MPKENYRALLYRTLTALGVVLAFFLTMIIPQHMRESTDWSFQYAVQNFSQGLFTVDGITIGLEESEAAKYSGVLSQYVMVGEERWALTEAPGYVFYLLPFYYINAPALGNLFLAAGMAAVAYLLLKRLKDERTACVGALLLLFTPVALAMMQRYYADSFGASAFLSMGGGLYLYYCLRRGELTKPAAAVVLFLAGLGLGWSVAANYYNALVVLVFILHFIFTQARAGMGGRRRESAWSALWLGLGMLIPMAGLLMYQSAVFGSPWRFGFQYTELPVGFATRFVLSNIKYVLVALLVGFPLLIPGLAALFTAGYNKIKPRVMHREIEKADDTWPELPGDLLLLLAGWILAVYGLYFNYEWTANTALSGMPFIVLARYYLPAALPLTLLSALWLARVPRKLFWAVLIPVFVWGLLFFAQSALSYYVVPPKSPYNPSASVLPQNTADAYYMLDDVSQNGVNHSAG